MWRMRESPGTSFHYILILKGMNVQDAVVSVKYAHEITTGRQGWQWKGKLLESHVWLWVSVCVVIQVQDHWHHRKRWRAGCGESQRVWNDCWRILSGVWGDHHHELGKTEVDTLVNKKHAYMMPPPYVISRTKTCSMPGADASAYLTRLWRFNMTLFSCRSHAEP